MIRELNTPTVATIEPKDVNVTLRSGAPGDADRCGQICYQAFRTIADQHNFPPDFPDPDAAIGLMSQLFERRNIYSVVAEMGGRVVGSNFLREGETIAGVGPITVEPHLQNIAVGRRLMEEVFDSGKLKEYKSKVLPMVTRYGGRYVVLGGKVNVMEGQWQPTFPVMIEFPSIDRAHEWYASDEYRELKALRLSAVRSSAVFIEGL